MVIKSIDACGDRLHAIPGHGSNKMHYCMQLIMILLSIRRPIFFFSQKAPPHVQEGFVTNSKFSAAKKLQH